MSQAKPYFGPGNHLCDRLHCRYPVLQAGMGGVARAELVAAVGCAGGYGFLGMVREPPERIAVESALAGWPKDTLNTQIGTTRQQHEKEANL